MCEFFSLYASLVSTNCFQNKFDFNINIVQDNYASTSVAVCPRLRRSFVKIHILNDRPLALKYNCHICFYCVFTVSRLYRISYRCFLKSNWNHIFYERRKGFPVGNWIRQVDFKNPMFKSYWNLNFKYPEGKLFFPERKIFSSSNLFHKGKYLTWQVEYLNNKGGNKLLK